jgi:DNA-directed RNA polymerase specialized sigma24 family protein
MSTLTRPDPSAEGLETIEETLTKLEPEIRKLAKHWSRDCPDNWEDLAQIARVAIYLELKEKPESPRTHLFRQAKHEILDYRKMGKSVDGKLDKTYKRKHIWGMVSLDAEDSAPIAIGVGADPVVVVAARSNLYFKPHQLRPVEDLALTRVAFEELRGRLTEQQRQYLALRLQGYKQREAEVLLGLSPRRGACLRDEVRKEAGNVLLSIWKQ